MKQKGSTNKPPPQGTKELRCRVSSDMHRVVEALLQAPPHNGSSVQDVLLAALISYIPHEQWRAAADFVHAHPPELLEDHIISRRSA